MGLTLAQLFSLGLTILSLAIMLYLFSLSPAKSRSASRK